MNIKSIREQASRSSVKLEDAEMEDVSIPEEPVQRKSAPKVEPVTLAIHLAFDGFDKSEVARMNESIMQLWVNGRAHPIVKVLSNLPTKLTGTTQNQTVVISKLGSYKSVSDCPITYRLTLSLCPKNGLNKVWREETLLSRNSVTTLACSKISHSLCQRTLRMLSVALASSGSTTVQLCQPLISKTTRS